MSQSVKFRINNLAENLNPGELGCFLGLKSVQNQCRVELILDSVTGLCKGYGFVSVPSDKAEAILHHNGLSLKGLPLMISRINNEGGRISPRKGKKSSSKQPVAEALACRSSPSKSIPPATTAKPKDDKKCVGVLSKGGTVTTGGSQLVNKPSSQNQAPAEDSRKVVLKKETKESKSGISDKAKVDYSGDAKPKSPVGKCPGSYPQDAKPKEVSKTPTSAKKKSGRSRRGWMQNMSSGLVDDPAQWAGEYCNYLSDTEYAYLNGMRGSYGEDPSNSYCLIDASAILTHAKFRNDVEMVICRAQLAGIRNIVVTALDIRDSKAAYHMANSYQGYLYFTAGIHPHTAAKTYTDQSISQLKDLASKPNCVAIGECGLDYNRNFSPRDIQLKVFEEQVELACKMRKPLLLHERDAHDDFLAVLIRHMDELPPVLVHCFTGTATEALKYLALGFYIGITGFIWRDFKKNGLHTLLRNDEIPLDKVIIETDSPFMQPRLDRPKTPMHTEMLAYVSGESLNHWDQCLPNRNEPCSLPAVVELVAACWGRSPHQVAKLARENARTFFSIPK